MENLGVSLPVAVASISSTTAAGLLLHRWLRPKFPVTVNCWFCGQITKVPYGNKNCWDCPHCEQYNGFNEDGDYNKPIPAQHEESFNEIYGDSTSRAEYTNNNTFRNDFCDECNSNQQFKIIALAHFVPLNEDSYDNELTDYKSYLERVYRLCRKCEVVLRQTLGQQDSFLRPKVLDWRKKRNKSFSSSKSSIMQNAFIKKVYPSTTITKYFYLLSFIIFLLTACLHLIENDTFNLYSTHKWAQLFLLHYISDDIFKLNHQLGYLISFVLFVLGISAQKFSIKTVDVVVLLCQLINLIVNSDYVDYCDYVSESTEQILCSVILLCNIIMLLWSIMACHHSKRPAKVFARSSNFSYSRDASTTAWLQNKLKSDTQSRRKLTANKNKENLQTTLGAMSLGTPRKSNKNQGVFKPFDYRPSSSPPVFNYASEDIRSRRPILTPPRLVSPSPQPYNPWPLNGCWQHPQALWSSPLNGRVTSTPLYNYPQYQENGNFFPTMTANNSIYCPSYPSSRVGSVYNGEDSSFYNFNFVNQQDIAPQFENNMKSKRSSEKGTDSSKSSLSMCPVDTTTTGFNISENGTIF